MLVTLATLILATTQAASPETLTGTVQDERGQPIANANVFISTAAPRQGVGVL
jgi:protocatechuate 3,4-dioxygenase beta subunit